MYRHKGMVCVTRMVGGQGWGRAGGEVWGGADLHPLQVGQVVGQGVAGGQGPNLSYRGMVIVAKLCVGGAAAVTREPPCSPS